GPRLSLRVRGALRRGRGALRAQRAGRRLDRGVRALRSGPRAPASAPVGADGVTAIRKAIVLARGLGSRMRREDRGAVLDAAREGVGGPGVRARIPIGRRFLDFVLSGLADAGYAEACLVIGPEHGAVRDHYAGAGAPRRIAVAFAVQGEPLGTAD